MKSPADIAARLAKQWHQTALRTERLLDADCWPLSFSVGKPTAVEFAAQPIVVQEHIQRWRQLGVGEVIWQEIKYRGGADPVSMPVRWCIRSPSEWAAACADIAVQEEFGALESLVGTVSDTYREVLIRERALWKGKKQEDVVLAVELSDSLSPGAASGRPLRLLAGLGVDTKFFERNATLLTRLLDQRYQGAASEQGLQSFLDAYGENDHWVLLVPLDRDLLPFRRQRVTTRELAETLMPASRILIVENEQCIHLLPELRDTIAILGAGLDLQWLQGAVFSGRSLAYWGDMDTWGLLMLARARQYFPAITPLLMSRPLFESYAHSCAVVEPVIAQEMPPEKLTEVESDFYRYLLNQGCGRLEQEYLPKSAVSEALFAWLEDC